MSERTTIGGTVYEAIGSSSSNLLLKCNGTARIQWGNKLIDLIKNGKIASGDSKQLIFTVSDESEIQTDGIYVLTTEESNKLLVYKDGIKYNFTEENLYILANESQNLTSEQKEQALKNIGLYYNKLEDVYKADIKNGIVYVLDTNNFYIIKNGAIEEFQATLKSVTVDEETDGVKVINSSVKIILSILDEEYLVLADQRITANYSIYVKNSAQIGSESADKNQGYRLYIDGDTSYLDVDEINVRNGIKVDQYKEVTFESLLSLINSELLEPHSWYLITNFQNHWKLPKKNSSFDRPILIRALTNKSFYEKGYLFKDHRVIIKYDPLYQEPIIQKEEIEGKIVENEITTKGRITWMQDQYNNEANFDFLDYADCESKELTTLHFNEDDEHQDKSIFPLGSYNNKLTVYNLKGTVLKEKVLDDTNTSIIDFKFDDSEDKRMLMHDNDIECYGLILNNTCNEFCNNIIKKSIKLEISDLFCENNFNEIYFESNFQDIENFYQIDNIQTFNQVLFSHKTKNNKCQSFKHCIFKNELFDNIFGDITNVVFNEKFNNTTINTVIKSSTNYTYQYQLYNIVNSFIHEISEGAVLKGDIIDSSIIKISDNSSISGAINNSNIKIISGATLKGDLLNVTINNIENSSINTQISNSTFNNISNNCELSATFDNVIFKNLSNCSFDSGNIKNVQSFYDLSEQFNSFNYELLYNPDKRKEIYITDRGIKIICIPDVIFYRGMIVMHSGIEEIPKGWAPCDGGTYEWEGVTSQTPNLINKFIKSGDGFIMGSNAVGDNYDTVDPNLTEDNKLKLTQDHLPTHRHPHLEHSHSASYADSNYVDSYSYSYTDSTGEDSRTEYDTSYQNRSVSHTHTIYSETSEEDTSITFKNELFSIEPHAYKLIFIMKL